MYIGNGTKVYYCTVVMTVIGKTEGGALILQSDAGMQMIVNAANVSLL